MTVAMTYNSLIQDIQYVTSKGGDPSFRAEIPNIILDAQYDLSARLKIVKIEQTVEDILLTGVSVIQKPSYWGYTVEFGIYQPQYSNLYRELQPRSLGYLRRFQNSDDHLGIPKFYADLDNSNTFQIAPIPISPGENYTGYPYTLVFHPELVPINENIQQNLLTMRFPQLLLNMSLMYAFQFLRNSEFRNQYNGYVEAGIHIAQQNDQIGKADRGIVTKIS